MCRIFAYVCLFLMSITASGTEAGQGIKVFISVDMEGIGGAVSRDQVGSSGRDYNRFRKLMTEEANAAIQGALDAGATEIIVNDSHGSMRNILIEDLNPFADLISGSPKQLSMMEGIDETYDAVVFVGYHASMGVKYGIMDHTMSSANVANIKINGRIHNEAGLNAAIAGYYGVPVVFISGDKAVVDETRAIIGSKIEGAAVKEGVAHLAARNVSVQRAREMIREGVRRGIENRSSMPVYKVTSPVKLEIEFLSSGRADQPSLIPGVIRVSGREVSYTGQDFIEVFKLMRALLILAASGA